MTNQTAASGADTPRAEENFAALFAESLQEKDLVQGTVVKGKVIAIENDMALIDVGLKAEGRVQLKEFAEDGQSSDIKVGDVVEVFLDRVENRVGEAVLSREKAKREEAWVKLEEAFKEGERVEGMIFGRVKGGFTVDLSGAVAFLPGSQVDIRPVRDITPLMGIKHPFFILKMDRHRGNIVVSRRAVLEESRAEARADLIANLKEGQVLEGVVKNITDYGAFVDLGGVDGLLHVTDIAWRRINHPTEALSIGQTVKVQVIRFNPETQRISLGTKFRGRVTNITDYGAFVELEPGVEGLVHVSEMSWTKKNVHPGKIVSTSQEVEVMVLDVNPTRRRISLGLKQCYENPWTTFQEQYPVGGEVEGEVKNTTEFGLFVGLPGDIDGLVHLSDLSWDRPGEEAIKDYKKGDTITVKVLDVDVEKERISLGVKQLSSDPFAAAVGGAGLKRGARVTCAVTEVLGNGIAVEVDGATGFIRKAELSRDRGDQRPDRFAVGEKIDAKVTSVDKAARKVNLSIKALEVEEEKKAMASYGSTDSGASLGDILGAALSRANQERAAREEATEAEPETATKAKKTAKTKKADDEAEAEAAPEKATKPKKAAKAKTKDADEGEAASEKAAKAKKATKAKKTAKAKADDAPKADGAAEAEASSEAAEAPEAGDGGE